MARDLKKMFKEYSGEISELPRGHEARFTAKLEKAFPENREGVKSFERKIWKPWLKMAVMFVLLLGVGFFGYFLQEGLTPTNHLKIDNSIVDNNSETSPKGEKQKLSLADISPELKKVEDYYMAGINLQLASLKINGENEDLVAGYMQRLGELDREYSSLNTELIKMGSTETTVTALIDNLKLRLDLLFKLKNKLMELKNQNNEDFNAIQS